MEQRAEILRKLMAEKNIKVSDIEIGRAHV